MVEAFNRGGATAFGMATVITAVTGSLGWWVIGASVCATMAVILYIKSR